MAVDRILLSSVKQKKGSLRKDTHKNIIQLAQSIVRTTLQNPIGLDRDNYLIQGRRRFNAFSWLHTKDMCAFCLFSQSKNFEICPDCQDKAKINKKVYQSIPYTFIDLAGNFHGIAELEENLEREDLSPVEIAEARTTLNSSYKNLTEHRREKLKEKKIQVLKEDKTQSIPSPSKSKVWRDKDTANRLGISPARLSQHKLTTMFVAIYPDLRDMDLTEASLHREFFKRRREAIRSEFAKRQEGQPSKVNLTLKQGDSLELIKDIEDETIDLIFTDVPYGIEIEKTSGQEPSSSAEWNDKIRYSNIFLRTILVEIERVLRQDTHAFIFCSYEQTFIIHRDTQKMKGFLMEIPPVIWDKVTPISAIEGSLTHDKRHEYLVHLRKGSPTGSQRLGPDIRTFPKVRQPKYPTEKPINLIKDYLTKVGQPGFKVLDPCCGSGSVLIAALQLGYKAIGFDLSEKAISITKSRVALEID